MEVTVCRKAIDQLQAGQNSGWQIFRDVFFAEQGYENPSQLTELPSAKASRLQFFCGRINRFKKTLPILFLSRQDFDLGVDDLRSPLVEPSLAIYEVGLPRQ